MTSYIGYSPNDFLYVQAGSNFPSSCNIDISLNTQQCVNILQKQYRCLDVSNSGVDCSSNCVGGISREDTDIIKKCYERELCRNKEKADELNKIQTNHLGSNRRYDDTKELYWNEMIKTTNLIVGIGGLCFLSFFVI